MNTGKVSELTSTRRWTGHGGQILGDEHMFTSKRIDGVDAPNGMFGIMRVAVELCEVILD